MKRLKSESEFTGKGSVVALGMFDGVHIGHQRLIRTAVQLAHDMSLESVVCTFDRHPLSVLCPERAPDALLSLEENLRKFELLGADNALVKPFSREFAAMLPEDYLEELVDGMRARAIVVGENYTFGREGRGNAQMIHALAPKYGYIARIVPSVEDTEGMISSTRIRAMMQSGQVDRAQALMEIRRDER